MPYPHRVFVGRDRELAALDAAFARAMIGRGSLVRISGEPGVGKTRLADAFAERCPSGSVGWARSWDGSAAFAIFHEAIRDALRSRSASVRANVAALLEKGSSRDARFTSILDALSLLGDDDNSSSSSAGVLVLDDVHAADTDSLALLSWISSQLRSTRILIITTQRNVGLTPDHDRLLGAIARNAETTIDLEGLDAAAIGQLITIQTGADADPRIIEAVHRGTRGNALFVDGILRSAFRDGSFQEGTIRFPRDVEQAIFERVEAVGPTAREMLRIAALSSSRAFTVTLLSAAAKLDENTIMEGLSRAVDDGMLVANAAEGPSVLRGTWSFRHALFADGLVATLPVNERASLHTRLADAIESVEGPSASPAEIAFHRVHAALVAGANTNTDAIAAALEATRRAAVHAASIFAYDEAARFSAERLTLLERCVAHDRAAVLETMCMLGDQLVLAGRRADARDVLRRAVKIARDDRLGGGAVAAGDTLTRLALAFNMTSEFGHLDEEKLSLLEEALATTTGGAGADGAADEHRRARLLATLASESWVDPDRTSRADDLSKEAINIAERLGDPALEQLTLDARFQSIWGPDHVRERMAIAEDLVARARASRDPDVILSAHRRRMLVALEVGDMATFTESVDTFARMAAELRRPALDETVLQRRLVIALVLGDMSRAEALAHEIHACSVRTQNPQADMGLRFALSEVHLIRGDIDALRTMTAAFAADADRLSNLPFIRARAAQVAAVCGEIDVATRHLDAYLLRARTERRGSLVTLAALSFATEAVLSLSSGPSGGLAMEAVARELLDRLTPYRGLVVAVAASIVRASVDHYCGLLEERLGDFDAAATSFEAALAKHQYMQSTHLSRWSEGALARVRSRKEPATTTVSPSKEACCRWTDAGWEITFGGRTALVGKGKGFRIITELVARPRVELHVLELSGAGDLKLSSSSSEAPILDPKAKAAYKSRLEDLRAAEAEAEKDHDLARMNGARAEREALEAELASALGLGGRDRQSSGGNAERARVAVAKSVTRALETLAEKLPEAAAHLERSIKTGIFCAYDPDPTMSATVVWSVEL